MIHGVCVGGGVGMALNCDLRLAADDARFGIPAARLGLGYHYHGMEKLMKLIGPAYTKELFFTARTDFSAQDALRMGLVNQVRAQGGAGELHPGLRAPHLANAPLDHSLGEDDGGELLRPEAERDFALLDKLIADCFNSEDYQEGVKAFGEKRAPSSRGGEGSGMKLRRPSRWPVD